MSNAKLDTINTALADIKSALIEKGATYSGYYISKQGENNNIHSPASGTINLNTNGALTLQLQEYNDVPL